MQSFHDFFDSISPMLSTVHDKKIVLVGGCFDVLHIGHIEFLKSAKQHGDILVVALESDEFIQKNKKRVPVHSQQDREYILQSLKPVDMVIKLPYFPNSTYYSRLVQTIHPSIIAITEGDSQQENKSAQAKNIGASCIVVTPLIQGYSTTSVLNHHNA